MEFIHINLRRLTQTLHNYLIEYHLLVPCPCGRGFDPLLCPSLLFIPPRH